MLLLIGRKQKWIVSYLLFLLSYRMDRKARTRENIYRSFEALESEMQIDNPNAKLVFDNQKEAGWEIFENFNDGIMAVTLLALPQVGKTGVMLWISYLMTTAPDEDMLINPKNVYIISGMNDIDWQKQTKASFPTALNEHVYTRSDFNKIKTLNSLENALIIIDECHIAAEERQQLSRSLERAGLNNPEILREKKVHILQVSATPAHTLFNADRVWGENHAVVRLQPSPKYIGFQQLLDAERIMDTYQMTPSELFAEIQAHVQLYTSPKYHIFRLAKNDKLHFDDMISRNSWISKVHNSQSREDTDLLFETPPLQHTFIVIKGFWRAGKRLNDQNIGIMYEGPSNIPDVNVIAQSLAGRACGNDKQPPGNNSPLIYCHKKSIVDYVNWAKGDGTFENMNYKSRHLNVDELGNVNVRSSFHGGTFVRRISDYNISEQTFDTKEDAKAWATENLTYNSTFYNTFEKNGILHIRYRGNDRALLTEEEARASTLINIGANSAARIMPVSSDLGWGVKTAARIMPVDIGQGANTAARIMPVTTPNLRYIVIYKKDKLRALNIA
jgi:hypothetical protein